MIGKIKRKIASLIKSDNALNTSFSQCGEDLIMRYILTQLGIYKPAYIDIGAHHPKSLNNTFLFYKAGSSGVNVEPDPLLYKAFQEKRPLDINLNIGVSFDLDESKKDFYIMSAPTLNTFSKSEAERIELFGSYKIIKTIQIETVNINNLLETYFNNSKIDLLTIDIEGLDFEVLAMIDYDKYRPLVLCVETLSYSEDKTETKNIGLIEFIKSKNYMVYADTYINTIFVDVTAWSGR